MVSCGWEYRFERNYRRLAVWSAIRTSPYQMPHYGRPQDDKGKWLWNEKCGALEWRTAGPSASPDFLSRAVASVNHMWFLFRQNHISGRGERGEVGNLGTLEMTVRKAWRLIKSGCLC